MPTLNVRNSLNYFIKGKVWSLEDDDEDDGDDNNDGDTNTEAESDEDPLDAFMSEINKEVKKGKSNFVAPKKTGIVVGVKKTAGNKVGVLKSKNGSDGDPKKPFIVMSGVAKKKDLNVDKR